MMIASRRSWYYSLPLLAWVTVFPFCANARADEATQTESKTPPASRLLPAETLAYLRIRDVEDLRYGFANSTLGKMLDDPAMQPFVSDTYQTISQWFDQAASEFGLPLDQLLDIPQGQFAAALVQAVPVEEDSSESSSEGDAEMTDEEIKQRMQRRQRQQNGFAGVFMIETGEDNESMRTMRELLKQVSALAEKNKSVKTTETIGDHELTRWVRSRGQSPVVEWFDRDGMFVVGIGNQTAAEVLRRWNALDAPKNRKAAQERASGVTESTDSTITVGNLSGNADFAAVMTRSIGAEAETPQITFFVNPYAIAQRIIRRSSSSFFILPVVEDLGLAKLRGIGGSIFRGGDIVENVIHIHVVIDPPRDGFLGVIRPEPVAPQPPQWVPADVASYLTSNWDVSTAFDNLSKIVDRFAGEGSFNRFTEDRIEERVSVSVRDDLIANLTGRYVGIQRYQPPANWNSNARADALEVIDVAKAKEMLATVRSKLPPGDLNAETISGVEVLFIRGRNREDRPMPQMIRVPQRSVMLLDNYLVISDSREIVETILKAHNGSIDRLSDDSDYALMASEIGVKLGNEDAFFLSFNRDAESYRVIYEMAASPDSRNALQRAGENNPTVKQFGDLLERQQLPAFDELRKYFNVSGGFGYDEPGGLHFGIINLRPLE
ncbi:DUF3352 domain-containing protein [Neorhodopirellula pilleata]|uniref:Bacterial type II/III secretion system short domain protein n=1 Tax=Neorhodopirellula pilleata TaxID=2714738 RepID=A0A5C6A4P6_9BACT|nr:DUF3352 domain-containing protein [Neorhodopirellula pilleata]TWT94874.1 hypothetical protein Pla100_34450 [Neorhodopirellula pilleata]